MMHVAALSMENSVKRLPVPGKCKADNESTLDVQLPKQCVNTRHSCVMQQKKIQIIISDAIYIGCSMVRHGKFPMVN